MKVLCDVCAAEAASVFCCADEAALCDACDRRVHRANKLAGKHRRLALQQPSSPTNATAAGPLCDVCKERRGIVFCVEDRAILCADCDEPIHSANDLTAKHSRFLLVGAKLSAAELVDQDHQIPSPDGSPDEHENSSSCAANGAEDSAPPVLNGVGGGGGGGSSISEYLTNICPGWRVEDLLLDDAAFASKQKGRDDEVPFLDADLFDVVAAGARPEKRGGAWDQAPHVPQPAWASLEEVVPAPKAKAKQQQGRVREWYHSDSDSDVFAVPEISPTPPAKRARPSPFWCL